MCPVLQGAHGLKGNEGPHGPPGPAVSTIYCVCTLIVFCFLNKRLLRFIRSIKVPGSERALMFVLSDFHIVL